jgi:glycine/D-amino acid oxidase-like deaminating enzyme
MDLTERHDLKTGAAPWDDGLPELPGSDPLPARPVDVAICGAGIMGASLAERLTAAGLSVALVDRRRPGQGSTAASTALILWEMDVPLTHLAGRIGEAEAVRRWARVRCAAENLWQRCGEAAVTWDRTAAPSLYLSGNLLDAEGLRAEAELRARHGLPSLFLPAQASAERFGIAARAAIVSAECFQANPLRLTLGFHAVARRRGATLSYPVDVVRITPRNDGVLLATDKGDLRARHAVLASGYERPLAWLPPAFCLNTSYALATAAGTAPVWRENAMLWEASQGYLYARADHDGRVIAGGGDEPFGGAQRRNELIHQKTETVAARLSALTGTVLAPRERWAAVFGTAPDGLPAIGRVRGDERIWLAAGFGGNGITFAALAAELIAAALTGRNDPDLPCFDPYRFGEAGGAVNPAAE